MRPPVRFRLRMDRRPARRRRYVHSPLQSIAQALEQCGQRFGRLGDLCDDGAGVVGIDCPAGDELRQQRDVAAAGVLERERGIAAHERFDGEPQNLRQVLIAGIFAVRHERARDRPPLIFGDALKSRREIEAHDG